MIDRCTIGFIGEEWVGFFAGCVVEELVTALP